MFKLEDQQKYPNYNNKLKPPPVSLMLKNQYSWWFHSLITRKWQKKKKKTFPTTNTIIQTYDAKPNHRHSSKACKLMLGIQKTEKTKVEEHTMWSRWAWVIKTKFCWMAREGQRPISKAHFNSGTITQVSFPPTETPSIVYPSKSTPFRRTCALAFRYSSSSLIAWPIVDK